jgi:uncharacterized protein (TIGR03083 family)
MSSSSPWPIIHRERAALADELASVPEADWNTSSLCEGWTVHQMLGHMVSTAKMTPPKFVVKFEEAGDDTTRAPVKRRKRLTDNRQRGRARSPPHT